MIHVKTLDGGLWVLDRDQRLTVNGHPLDVGRIAEILIDGAELDVQDATVDGTGQRVRAIIARDRATGIPVILPLLVPEMEQLAAMMRGERIQIARSLPPGL